ncbi:MAG: hypothetical protein RLZZ15_4105, partial [Verrucomicrobiota bacterium]
NNPQKKAKGKKAGAAGGLIADNGVFAVLTGVTEQSVVSIETAKGKFSFKLADIPYGKVREELGGAVDIERVAASRALTTTRDDDDFPALAVAADGTTAVAWVTYTPGIDRDERARAWDKAPADFSFLAKRPGGDRVWFRLQQNGRWSEPVAVTAGGGDVFKCAVAFDAQQRPWVFWSENKNWPAQPLANFELYAAPIVAGKVAAPINLSNHPGTDHSAVATTDSAGRIWLAWQAARDNRFVIVERHQAADGTWTPERTVSTQTANCWSPAIATTKGRVAIAWDTYEKGDYDVWLREFADGAPLAPRAVANTIDYEARPAVTYDLQSRLWIAWEKSGASWGKDWGALVRDKGIGLYRDRQIGMIVLAPDGQWLAPAQAVATALPGATVRRGPRALPVQRPEGEFRVAGEEAEVAGAFAFNNIARLACDRDGRIWLFARSREGTFHVPPMGSVWSNYAALYDGDRWTGPVILPHSDNLLYNSPAVAAHPAGGFVVAHSSDHRQDRHITRGAAATNNGLAGGSDPFDNDIFVSRLEMNSAPIALKLVAAKNPPAAANAPAATTVAERAAIARAREQRIDYDGKKLVLQRGEFHRHTELSGDAGGDGAVEDMWRYAIDVAGMDWLGNGDHDNGAGREYPWWIVQKTTDAYRLPGRFDPPFTYERSVRYPEGHRNVVFAQRGVRTLPRLPISAIESKGHAPDTLMLYDYLKTFNGVCASHTSATDMGTDWRDNHPLYEPMVEIYQGCRQNYERPGAPRSPTEGDAIGGWRPAGFVNLAFKKGYRFSFQASSDHTSTHISYALVYAADHSREALLAAMRARHTYAATDNIVADFRCRAGDRDHMLGDEFTITTPPTLRLKLVGTAPFAKVTLVKDDVEIPLPIANAHSPTVDLTWTDPSPTAGATSYYYVRGEQTDGELVWVSPMWITYTPAK